MTLTSTPVVATVKKLLATWSCEVQQDLDSYHGLDHPNGAQPKRYAKVLRNAARPGLKPHKRRYWSRLADKLKAEYDAKTLERLRNEWPMWAEPGESFEDVAFRHGLLPLHRDNVHVVNDE
jgi:hypothetical protein